MNFKAFKGLLAVADSPSFRRRFLFWFAVLGFLPLLIGGGGLLLLAYFIFTLPPTEAIERMAPSLITRVYAADSTLVREYFTERRVWTPLDSFPESQVHAVLAIEDQAFYRHGGVDLKAIPSALLPALSGKRVRGASTLTQQLTKRVFLTPERSLIRKLREILLAVQIERAYTKREILEFYLNQVYLGAGAYGFSTAAERYFSKPLGRLTVAEQALLAGLLQRPESLRPDRRPEASLDRRNVVLRAMADFGVLTSRAADSAMREPLALKPKVVVRDDDGEAGYFVETVRQRLEQRWGRGFMDSAGAEVHTTLDRRVQDLADSCLRVHVASIQGRMNVRTARELGLSAKLKVPEARLLKQWDYYWARFDSLYLRPDTAAAERRFPVALRYHKVQGAIVVIENGTGAVRALSGGLDWRESNYNRAIQAVRSPGSAFKALVYAAAVDQGATPGARVEDKPITLEDPDDTTKNWSPQNLDYLFEGPMTMRRAFYRSRNVPAVEVARLANLDSVAAYARRFGLSQGLRPVPALALGGCDATPFEMTAAFAVFPNAGEWLEPRLLESVHDRNGAAMALDAPMRRRVISPQAAWILSGMLQDVNIRGTAAHVWASGFQIPSGGKTGTSNDFCDAWYIGFTGRYTVGVWVGADDHASMGPGHTGTDDALPIWLSLMPALHRGVKSGPFERPPGVEDVRVCKWSGRLARAHCDSVAADFRAPPPEGSERAGSPRAEAANPLFSLAACAPELHADEPQNILRAGAEAAGGFFRGLWRKTPWGKSEIPAPGEGAASEAGDGG